MYLIKRINKIILFLIKLDFNHCNILIIMYYRRVLLLDNAMLPHSIDFFLLTYDDKKVYESKDMINGFRLI